MTAIDMFQEKVMRVQPNNFMALNGAAAGILGAADSGSAAVAQLKRVVIDFTGYFKAGYEDAYIQAARKEVLAKIMVALTMDAITQELADELITDLQKLMKERT